MATTSCLLGSCLALTTSIDRTQRHSSFGISTSSLRPRVWRTSDTALSASARTGQLLTGAHGIPSVERYGATVSRPPCRLIGRCMPVHGDAPQYLQQFTRTADIPSRHRQTPVLSHWQSVRSCCQTFYCRSQRLPCPWCSYVERFTVGRYLLTAAVHI